VLSSCPICIATASRSGFCPLHTSASSFFSSNRISNKQEFSGPSPAPFIGRFGYPCVNVGFLSVPYPIKDAELYDAPRHWANEGYTIPQIINLRSFLLHSRKKSSVYHPERFVSLIQEVGTASKPFEIEISLKNRPVFKTTFFKYASPVGPQAEFQLARATENPVVHRHVDKVVCDGDLPAKEAIHYLYQMGHGEGEISKVLSVGAIGIQKQRRLVPTRYSITATDDQIGGYLLSSVKDFQEDDYEAFFGGYLGNYFLVLFFSQPWSFELFEIYLPKDHKTNNTISYTTDFESFYNRKTYARETVGGYYACRLAVLEHLFKKRRQAGALVLRFITEDYTSPLGVFVVREASRRALLGLQKWSFSSKEELILFGEGFCQRELKVPIEILLKSSKLISQRTIGEY